MSTIEQAGVHGTVQHLLPWFANQTLSADEMALVREHLRGCQQCRDDAAWQQRLRAAEPQAPAGLDAERALARLMPQLGTQTAAQPVAVPGDWRQLLAERWCAFWTGRGWMPWALAGQGALIAGLVFQLLPDAASDYRALSNGGVAAPQPGNVVVVFRADVEIGQVQNILQANGARMVDGPTVTGAFVLDVPDASQARVLAALKADPVVQLAEPLVARRAP